MTTVILILVGMTCAHVIGYVLGMARGMSSMARSCKPLMRDDVFMKE